MSKPNPIRVLVVEDREDDFRYLSFVFAQARRGAYELDWAPSFEEGLAALRRGGHDVALFDYSLGARNGVELLEEARALDCQMPILLLTGHDNSAIDEAAERAGAVDFMSKAGLEPVQLERALRYALRQAEIRARLRHSQQQLDLFVRSVPCAVAIHDAEGQLIFQNDLFARYFRPDAPAGEPPAPGPARACVSGGRHWLVNTFDMAGADGRHLRGFTALDVSDRVQAENERRRTAQLLDSITENLPAVAGRLDAAGRIGEARGHGLDHAGLTPASLQDRLFAELHPQAGLALQEALGGEATSFLVSGRAGESEWHVEFVVVADAVQGEGATFFARDVTARHWLERRLLTVTDAEQQRIGADLHDGLGQHLTGLSCMAAALRDRLRAGRPEDAGQAETISRLANEAIEQSRALARGLCPVRLEGEGLAVALEELAGQARVLHAVDCVFEMSGPPPRCEHLTAMHVYRITQEAINNAVRHGKAQRIRVRLSSRRGQHRLVVTDDGCGFDAGARRRGPGGGIRLMGYRAAMIGGVVSTDSKPGRGTRVTCHFSTFPFNNHESKHLGKTPDQQTCEVVC
ncbi:MAG TPA: response regulator [Opitutaceae bacterium]|nr:response regulator [Opitutaceae bacterium]